MKPFDVTHEWCLGRDWPKYGQRWDDEEKATLLRFAQQRYSLHRLCGFMQRPAAGVLAKLIDLHQIERVPGTDHYQWVPSPSERNHNTTQQPSKESAMTTPNIETKTFINGSDASSMNDAQIFSKIATLEAEHNRLDGIQNKPKKLVAVMAAIKEDIAKLVAYVDSRA